FVHRSHEDLDWLTDTP
ncbi:hypothetical protein D039_2994B, partial [Vibrio parahaemolyticus EKP-028]